MEFELADRDLDLVLRIYDTVADQARWTDVLDRVADLVGARGSLVFEEAEAALQTTHMSSWYVPEIMEAYNVKHRDTELEDQARFLQNAKRNDSIDIISDEILYDDLETFKQRPNVRHVMQFGILHRAAVLLNKDNPNISRFSVQFPSERGPITPEESHRLNLILPHVAKALDLGRPTTQLAKAHQGLLAAMDRLTIGICLLDGRGRKVVANHEFDRQQDAYRFFETAADGRVKFNSGDAEKRFDALKAHALNHGQFGARPRKEAISTGADAYLCIEVTPLETADEMGSGRFGGFILYSTDTSLPVHCETAPIKHAYGLTDTEVQLVSAISEGMTNAQIAEMRNRSVATVNAQVKSILSKTHCATRTQFVRLLMGFGTNFLRHD